jgi:hypothetical protein
MNTLVPLRQRSITFGAEVIAMAREQDWRDDAVSTAINVAFGSVGGPAAGEVAEAAFNAFTADEERTNAAGNGWGMVRGGGALDQYDRDDD